MKSASQMAGMVIVSAVLHGGWLAGCRSAVADFYEPLTGLHGCPGEPEGGAAGAAGAGGATGGDAGEGGKDACPAK